MEEEKNTILGCKEHFDKRMEEFQKTFDKKDIFIGCCVKRAFIEGEQVEHMWVIVTEIFKDKIKGKLDNDPAFIKNTKMGDEVEVLFSEISAIGEMEWSLKKKETKNTINKIADMHTRDIIELYALKGEREVRTIMESWGYLSKEAINESIKDLEKMKQATIQKKGKK
jgi:uncharacterized protein YegJ (DUF2314 family)